ncbi:MAG: hypothetical protein ACRELV_12530, partial [Longimicrobiales bacterium]
AVMIPLLAAALFSAPLTQDTIRRPPADTVGAAALDSLFAPGAASAASDTLPPPPLDSVYATDAVRALVARASSSSGEIPAALDSYEATVETDLALLRAQPDGREMPIQLEQVASRLFWAEGRPVLQRVVGYRSQTLGLTPSTLSFFEVPWLVPHLYGDRIDLVRVSAPVRDEQGRVRRPRTVHPFASDREHVYRFSGGDTVDVIRLPDRTIPIARIRVEPLRAPARPALVFDGVIDVETNTHHIVRMSGRIFALGTDPEPMRVLGALVSGVLFVEFENAEYDRAYWLPRTQRIETQAYSSLGDTRIAFRVISRFRRLLPNAPPPAELLALDPDSAAFGALRYAPRSVRDDYADWALEPGALSSQASVTDFPIAAPPALSDSGPPRLSIGTRHFSDLLRVNPVEGVFTGLGLTLDLRDAAPGLRLNLHGGWAWAEETARGGAAVTLRRAGWEYLGRAERQLAHTNDFSTTTNPEPGVTPMFTGDGFDLVDRRIASLIARQPRGPGWAWRLEAARAGDRAVTRHVDADDPDVRPIRPADEGDYWLGRVTVERNAAIGGLSVRPGLRARVHYELGAGELDWQRVEAGLGLRRVFGRFTLAGRADAGLVLADRPPPQQLFELGTNNGLSGFEEKAFTGDRAALARVLAMYTLPILGDPIALGGFFKLPGIAPAPSVEVQAGVTAASDDALAVMQPFGWQTSDGVRATIDLRLRFFGGGVSVGFARPLGESGEWRFVWGLVAEI